MVVCFLRDQPDIPSLYIDGKPLERLSVFKVLGITLNDQLKWNNHVEVMVKKASKRLYILRVLRRSGVPACDLLTIYYAIIRSVLEYACAVWHTNLPSYLTRMIEMVQKRALRILYPGTHYCDALQAAHCHRLDDK